MTALSVDIIEESSLWGKALGLRGVITKAAAAVMAHPAGSAAMRGGEAVCVALSDDASIARLNWRWRNQNVPTNVLSFPTLPTARHCGPGKLGDIVLAYETVEREARADGKTINDHVAHLVAHAMLHLLGYNHETEGEAEHMEALEVSILATIGIDDPYETEAA
jgi:probable rRNA maturation factor